MNSARRICLAVVASMLSLGAVGLASPAAHADSAWPGGNVPHGPTTHG